MLVVKEAGIEPIYLRSAGFLLECRTFIHPFIFHTCFLLLCCQSTMFLYKIQFKSIVDLTNKSSQYRLKQQHRWRRLPGTCDETSEQASRQLLLTNSPKLGGGGIVQW